MTVASRCGDRPATEHHRSAGRLHRLSEAGGLSRAPGRHLATALAAPMAGGTAFFDALAAGGDPAKRTIQRTRRRSGREGVRPLLHLTARPEARTGTSRARVHVWGEHPPAKQPRTRSKQESGRRESNSRSQLGKLSPRRPHTSVDVHQRRSQGCLRKSACTPFGHVAGTPASRTPRCRSVISPAAAAPLRPYAGATGSSSRTAWFSRWDPAEPGAAN